MGERYTGVIDRFEGDRAVVLLESAGDVVDELVIDREDLPADGRHDDAVLTVELENGEPAAISYDATESERRKESAEERFDRLSERPPSDDENTNGP